MTPKSFAEHAMFEGNKKWHIATDRIAPLYSSPGEIRTEFGRDYTRILHSTAYRRLKHKTQVFFATTNDHVCTRIEHVNHVTSVSRTISNHLRLNTELVEAIAIGHDIGHAPFGHQGETVLSDLSKKHLSGRTFWHEHNSLRLADSIETLEGPDGEFVNLNLTYAVRDGIVCHCGEVDEEFLKPRNDVLDLNTITRADHVLPYTWEACVVKISDKIAYLGRDIEDARTLKVLDTPKIQQLNDILSKHTGDNSVCTANTVLIKTFIKDLCEHSTPSRGIILSPMIFSLMKEIKDFCYKNIYSHEVLERYKKFVTHVINALFEVLHQAVVQFNIDEKNRKFLFCPKLEKDFFDFLYCYCKNVPSNNYSHNLKIYDLSKPTDQIQACLDFLSGMTDQYALKHFKEIISY